MKQIESSEHYGRGSYVATIGFFDGVHRGHRFLLEQLRATARRRGLPSLVITFDNHPKTVVNPSASLPLLSTTEEKLRLLDNQGVDGCVLLYFTKQMAGLTARQFLEQEIVGNLGVDTLLIGYDHRFGHDRREGFDDYVRYGRELGLEIEAVPSLEEVNGTRVSSTIIRNLLLDGQPQQAADLLGRPYSLTGFVEAGHRIGRTFGFPTANLRLGDKNKLIPKHGVYAVKVTVNDERQFLGMMNIGVRPTLDNGQNVSLEVNLFNYTGDLYAHRIKVQFFHYLREERRFESIESLKEQITKDQRQIEDFFYAHPENKLII